MAATAERELLYILLTEPALNPAPRIRGAHFAEDFEDFQFEAQQSQQWLQQSQSVQFQNIGSANKSNEPQVLQVLILGSLPQSSHLALNP